MSVAEPAALRSEADFENAVVIAAEHMMRRRQLPFTRLPRFGLDVAFFIGWSPRPSVKLIEFKYYAGGRAGGVGFGTQQGRGPQVNLLGKAPAELVLINPFVRWALVDVLKPVATPRYALFDSPTAQAAAMGRVREGKQNNLRIAALRGVMQNWADFLASLERFLVD